MTKLLTKKFTIYLLTNVAAGGIIYIICGGLCALADLRSAQMGKPFLEFPAYLFE